MVFHVRLRAALRSPAAISWPVLRSTTLFFLLVKRDYRLRAVGIAPANPPAPEDCYELICQKKSTFASSAVRES